MQVGHVGRSQTRARAPGPGRVTGRAKHRVTVEDASGADRAVLFAHATALSARETELLMHLDAGRDTREIPEQMHLSEHTIQGHLKSSFTKTGIRTRRSLLGYVRGR